MIKNKFGPNMLAKDKQDLDNLIEGAVAEVGCDYGAVLEFVTDTVHGEKYSSALKSLVV